MIAKFKLAEMIGNDRQWAIGMTAASWARQDKEAATQYVESTEALDDAASSGSQKLEVLAVGDVVADARAAFGN